MRTRLALKFIIKVTVQPCACVIYVVACESSSSCIITFLGFCSRNIPQFVHSLIGGHLSYIQFGGL